MDNQTNTKVDNTCCSKDEGNINAAIFYLARSKPKDIDDLKRSLSLLDANFNDQFNYPVIIFHEDFTETLMDEIRKATNSKLHFEIVKFEIPDFLKKEDFPELIYAGTNGPSIGYRHMCRFMGGIVYQHPIVKNYKFLWRLDTDSFLLNRIDYDVFHFMQIHNYSYGYICILQDFPAVVKNLWETTKQYIIEKKIHPTFLNKFIMADGEWDLSYYYTNFEISKLDFWHSDEFMDYFNYIDRSGGIYKYRWGDAVIHLLAVSMFLPENKVHKFSDIAYQHQSFVNNYSIDMNTLSKIKNMKQKLMTGIFNLVHILAKRSKIMSKIYTIILKFVRK